MFRSLTQSTWDLIHVIKMQKSQPLNMIEQENPIIRFLDHSWGGMEVCISHEEAEVLCFSFFPLNSMSNVQLFMFELPLITAAKRQKTQFSTLIQDILMALLQYLMRQKLLRYQVRNLEVLLLMLLFIGQLFLFYFLCIKVDLSFMTIQNIGMFYQFS